MWCAANFDTASKCSKASGIAPPPGSTREGPPEGSTEWKMKNDKKGADNVKTGPLTKDDLPEHPYVAGTKASWDPHPAVGSARPRPRGGRGRIWGEFRDVALGMSLVEDDRFLGLDICRTR